MAPTGPQTTKIVLTLGSKEATRSLREIGLTVKVMSSVEALAGYRGIAPRCILIRSTAIAGQPIEEVVAKLRVLWPLVDIIVWSPRCSGDLVLGVLKAGAKDVVLQEDIGNLVKTVDDVIKQQKLLPRMGRKHVSMEGQQTQLGKMVSQSPKMWDVFELCRQVAPTGATVLLQGETGTGKELAARAIHSLSAAQGRFVAVNCSGVPETLLDSVLFGHVKGAFTGASHDKKGLFAHANKGTLFLDEIGSMPWNGQHHLLRVLQEGRYRVVGDHSETLANARVIAAASQDIESLAGSGTFREDLFYRLDVFRVTIPPLRERPEDIVFLFHYFAKKAAKQYKLRVPEYTARFIDDLIEFDWPGNVRQLENTAERLLLIYSGEVLSHNHFRKLMRSRKASKPGQTYRESGPRVDFDRPMDEVLEQATAKVEQEYLRHVLTVARGRISEAADAAGINRRTLLRKMKKYNLDKAQFKSSGT